MFTARILIVLYGGAMDFNLSDSNDLVFCARYGRIEAVRALLKNGVNSNIRDAESGDTALTAAAAMGRIEVVTELLKHGADINFTDEAGYTSLIRAATAGSVRVIEILIEFGADVNIQSNTGETALIYAVATGNIEVIRLLLQAGASVEVKDNGKSILDYVPSEKVLSFRLGLRFLDIYSRKPNKKIIQLLKNTTQHN